MSQSSTTSSQSKRIQKPRTTLGEIFCNGKFNMENSDIKRLFEIHGDEWMKHVKLIFNKTKPATTKTQCCALKLDKRTGETSQCTRNAQSGGCFCGTHNKIHGARNNHAIDMGCFDEFEFKWQQFGRVDANGEKQEASWIAQYRKRQSMKVKRVKKTFKKPTLPEGKSFEQYKAEQLQKMEARLNKKFNQIDVTDNGGEGSDNEEDWN